MHHRYAANTLDTQQQQPPPLGSQPAGASALEAQISDITSKLARERKMLEGSQNMFRHLQDKNARDQLEATIIETGKRIEYLEKTRSELSAELNNDRVVVGIQKMNVGPAATHMGK